ncbi:molecular chaperone TorD family protein [Vibrio sp. ZSDZ65]|uniref:Molecular chaperone TorD family protein n=1 Tax=Vibrio qingdaonensis TaxID=2829491 RepID=A0A9X3CMD3_9VIBR|nr:molecular chaperone TorD family protein [Vibrio qingdaonensis]MCW8345060.1 molecular chaperone TorD family protein [Vibrio qingdaonensis]
MQDTLQNDVIDLENLSAMAKVFGSLFYFPLTGDNNQALLTALADESQACGEPVHETAFTQWAQVVAEDGTDTLNQDFFLLFEGGEAMYAPPWGSVYLDKEEVIFGETTVAYRQFLRQNGVELDTGMREPEDQFGLMLFAVSQFIEEKHALSAIKALLSEHLFTWCYRYLELVEKHAQTNSYQQLALLATEWCLAVQELLDIQPLAKKLYR